MWISSGGCPAFLYIPSRVAQWKRQQLVGFSVASIQAALHLSKFLPKVCSPLSYGRHPPSYGWHPLSNGWHTLSYGNHPPSYGRHPLSYGHHPLSFCCHPPQVNHVSQFLHCLHPLHHALVVGLPTNLSQSTHCLKHLILTLIWIAPGICDSLNFEQRQLKMAWSKNIFYSISIPHKIY